MDGFFCAGFLEEHSLFPPELSRVMSGQLIGLHGEFAFAKINDSIPAVDDKADSAALFLLGTAIGIGLRYHAGDAQLLLDLADMRLA